MSSCRRTKLKNTIYLSVALPVPLRRLFHYLPPTGESTLTCQIGSRVQVPFGRQSLIGVVIAHSPTADFDPDKIKPATTLIDNQPILSGTILKLCQWAADYYHHSLGEVLHTALPVLLRQGESAEQKIQTLLRTAGSPNLERAPRQKALLEAIPSEGLSRYELTQKEFSAQTIRAVIERGAAAWQEINHTETFRPIVDFGEKLPLTAEQAKALEGIQPSGTHLLFGVTGSGKTEVYLQAIEAVIRDGKQALVLVPEIGLTPQTIARFEQRFPGGVVAMHSALSNPERLAAWRQARSGSCSVVIGTRSAIFTPLITPGLIVVDEEHDASFKQHDGFRYSARDLAVKRGQLENIPVILGSATPSLESYANANNSRYTRLDLVERANNASFAKYQVIGTEHQTLTEGFSGQLIDLMKQHLDADNQVLVFLNRRGFAPVLHCRQCRWLSNCERCDARMTYHFSTRLLVCHHCEKQQRAPSQCPDCGSREIVPLGFGTQRLEAGLLNLFPDEEILRIDRDSTRRKNALQDKLARINKGDRGILLGTQLLAKGHHFPNVTLVAIVDLDAGFFSSDYHAIERMGQLLLQVGGRAGRESKPGTVAIQTLYPEQPVLNLLLQDGYGAFCEALLEERSKNQLPPYTFHAVVRAEAVKSGAAIGFLEEIAGNTPNHPKVELLGPIPAPMEKRAGRFRAQLLISSEDRSSLHQLLKKLTSCAEQSPRSRSVRWSLDLDPYDLF